MRDSQHPCHRIQEDIACNMQLSQEDSRHVLSCSFCSDVAARVEDLDSLVRRVFDREIPPDFADRVVAKIWEEESQSDIFRSQWFPLLDKVFYSRGFQWVLVGIGSVFGLFKIFRFFSALFVHGFI